MWKCRGELARFHRATRRVRKTQSDVLRATLEANRESWFGRKHGFASIGSAREFQARVPLSQYADYHDPIERIAAGEKHVLTREAVTLLEPTSGTTNGEKLIPYTPSLRRSFQRGLAAWMGDLLRHRPAVRQGRAYWSISPALGPRRWTSGGLPIGFEDDVAYLGTVERWALRRLLVAPSEIARLGDIEAFRYGTLLRLLAAADLALVSVWNPSFLTSLLASLEDWIDRICHDLRRGTLSPPRPIAANSARALIANGPGARRRAEELSRIFRMPGRLSSKLQAAWPRLALVSCWADGAAAWSLRELTDLFPGVEVQPKGLLATEGFVSLPLCGLAAPALSLRSHFFEFDACGSEEAREPRRRLHLAHQLDRGGRYRVVLTTGGGLYRYQLHDEVEVVDFLQECPLVRFIGKSDRTSDLVGEKLNESHVEAVLQRVMSQHGLVPRLAILVPVVDGPLRYRLYVQLTRESGPPIDWPALRDALEAGLSTNPYYRYACELGQLRPIEIYWLDARSPSVAPLVQRQMLGRGVKAGDIKPAALDGWTGWPAALESLGWRVEPAIADRRIRARPSPEACR
jgi:hypothetical protein